MTPVNKAFLFFVFLIPSISSYGSTSDSSYIIIIKDKIFRDEIFSIAYLNSTIKNDLNKVVVGNKTFEVIFVKFPNDSQELMPCCELGKTSWSRSEYDTLEDMMQKEKIDSLEKLIKKSLPNPDNFLRKSKKGLKIELDSCDMLVFRVKIDTCHCEYLTYRNGNDISIPANYIKKISKIRKMKKKHKKVFQNNIEQLIGFRGIEYVLESID